MWPKSILHDSYGEPHNLLRQRILALHVCFAENRTRSSSSLRSSLAFVLRLSGSPLGNLEFSSFRSFKGHGRSRSKAYAIDPLTVIIWVDEQMASYFRVLPSEGS